jgi:hypothetical protein
MVYDYDTTPEIKQMLDEIFGSQKDINATKISQFGN